MRAFATVPSLLLAAVLHAQCSVQFAPDTVTLYWGYDPLACMQLSPSTTGAGPLAYAWNTGATTPSIVVCDTVSTWYMVTIIDTAACSATDSVFVNVVDVHCGNNGNKVAVCHIPPGNPANAHTICISENGVPAHLAHGCVLGPCAVPVDSLQGDGELLIEVSPNPMNEYAAVTVTSKVAQNVKLSGVDATGRVVLVFYEGALSAGVPRRVDLVRTELPERTRMVWLRLDGASGSRTQQALIIGD